MPTENSTKPPVIFVHGLWLHAESWQPWIEFFRENGYQASAVNWPGEAETTEATRQNPQAVAGYGIPEITDHIARQIKQLETRPILIGHSFGGLVAQNLLGRGLAAAGIAMVPASIKGVTDLPLSTIRAFFSMLINPFNLRRARALSERQFRYIFANTVSEQESRQLHQAYAIPGPIKPLFQAAMAVINLNTATQVVLTNGTRGPLLLIAAEADHVVPPVMMKSTLRIYRKSMAVTECKLFPGRGHSLTIDNGWQEIAAYCLAWLKAQGM